MELDRLTVTIGTSAKDVTKKINTLTASLGELMGAVNQLNVDKFQTLADASKGLSEGLKGLKGNSIKQIAKMSQSLEDVSASADSMKNISEKAEQIGQSAQTSAREVSDLNGAFKALGADDSFAKLSNQVKILGNNLTTSESSVKGFNAILSKMKIIIPTDELDKTRKKFDSLREKAQELSEQMQFKAKNDTSYVDSNAMERDKAKLEGLINEMERLKLKEKELESHGGFQFNVGSLKSAKQAISDMGSKLASITKYIGKFVSGFVGIPWAVNLARKSVGKLKSKVDDLGKSLARTYKMLRLMVTRMALRAVIKNATDGFSNLIHYSAEFDASVSLLWNSMRQLGNSVAAAVSPLINALAPALNYLIQLCIQAVNAINQLISSLLGNGTWIKAKTLTDDYAKSLDKGSKSASKLKKTILGFDEINQLQDNNSGGGASALTDPTNMFETKNIESKWKEFAEKLKAMWRDADFSELGDIIGRKLKEALEKIPWEKIKGTAQKVGKSLATLINGFVEVEGLGKTIGSTLAEVFNTALSFLNGYVRNLHWESIGKFIADTFNGFFDKIDWELLKDTVVTGIRGLATSISNFINRFNWDNISRAISNAVNIISEAVYAFFSEIDFGDLGEKLGTQLMKTVEGIDWEQLGKAIGRVVQSAINFVSGIIRTLDWTKIKDAISKLFEGFFSEVDTKKLALIIVGILTGVLVSSVSKILVSATIKLAGEKIVSALFTKISTKAAQSALEKTLGESMLGTAVAPSSTLAAACSTLGEALIALVIGNKVIDMGTSFWSDMILKGMESAGWSESEISNMKKDLEDLEKRYEGFSGKIEIFKDGWKMLTGTMDEADDKIANNGIVVEDLTNKTHNASIEVERLSSTFGDSSNNVGAFADSVDNVRTHAQTLSDYLKTDKSITDYSEKGQNAFKDLQTKADSTSFAKAVKESENLDSKSGMSFKNCRDNAKKLSDDFTTNFATISTTVKDNTTNIQTDMVSTSRTFGEETAKMQGMFTTDKWTFNGIRDGLSQSFTAAIEAVKGLWNIFAKWLNEKLTFKIDPIVIAGKTVFNGTTIDLGKLPTFATGGFPKDDSLFLANSSEMVGKFSNGRSVVANNQQITDGIAQAVYSAIVSANSGNSGSYINNTIQIDGETIARAVTKGQQSINRRYNPTM